MSEMVAYFSRAGENYVSGAILNLAGENTARVAGMIKSL